VDTDASSSRNNKGRSHHGRLGDASSQSDEGENDEVATTRRSSTPSSTGKKRDASKAGLGVDRRRATDTPGAESSGSEHGHDGEDRHKRRIREVRITITF
jgi:hypothetical protein